MHVSNVVEFQEAGLAGQTENYQFLVEWCYVGCFGGWMSLCQILGTILENKIVQQILSTNKNCSPNTIFFTEKKIRKISMIFDMEN